MPLAILILMTGFSISNFRVCPRSLSQTKQWFPESRGELRGSEPLED
jgi:hypothetical protein